MLPTVRTLLESRALALTLLTPESQLPDGALDHPLEWVHSSDLDDPTPFLSPGQMLLTTGTQLGADAATLAPAYVQRLVDHGITALGFGTEVIQAGTPEPLLAACIKLGLPLFEVPYRTPFIAVARAAADMVSEERFARSTWALGAQRAISLAALRPDGLSATLSELSRQLGHWVALFDARGELDRMFPAAALQNDSLDLVQKEAERLLAKGQRAGGHVEADGERLTLQTLGRRGNLRGVLALGGSAELDQAGQEVLTAVIALAGLALEQNHALDRARGHLRSGLLHTLLSGEVGLVRDIAVEMWGGMPTEPVRLAALHVPDARRDAAAEFLELRVEADPNSLFFGQRDGITVLCMAAGPADDAPVTASVATLIGELCSRFDAHAGLSDAVMYREVAHAAAQAEQALGRALEGEPGSVSFESISRQGVLAYLARTDAGEVARAAIAPIVDYDAAHGTELLRTVRVWLEQNGQFDAAARVLGVHRHTVRSRVAQLERLLGRDLSTFHARADVWAALLTAR